MIIHNAAITGSLTLNGIDISDITGSEASVDALNSFSSSILSYTASNDAKLTALNAQTASLLAYTSSNDARVAALNTFSSSMLSYTSSNDANILSLFANVSSLSAGSASAAVRINALNTFSASMLLHTASMLSYTASNTTNILSLNAAVAGLNSYTSSNTSNISSLNSYTSSANTRFAGIEASTASLNTFTSSINSRVTTIESKYATTGSNTFTGQQYISNTANANGFANTTGSFYTDGGARITKDMYVSGTAYFNNITVFGTQSVSYISSSQLNIGTNLITVNTDTPTIRFGGLAVYDSGSTGLTGSILWDSQNNHWVYSNPSGSSYSGGMFISGPRSAALGSEQGTTNNALMKGQGGDHITSSAVFEVSGSVGIGTSSPGYTLDVQGTGYFNGGLTLGASSGFPSVGLLNRSSDTNLYMVSATSGFILLDNSQNTMYQATPTAHNWNISNSFKMTLNSSGNLGIGTSTPTRLLEVYGASLSSDTPTLRISSADSSGTRKFGIEFYSRTGADVRGKIMADNGGRLYIDDNGGGGVILQTNGGTGGVGVGTTSPYQNLQVYQTGTSGNNYVEGTIQVGGTSSTLGAALSYAAQNSGYVNLVNLNTSGGANARISLGFGAISSGLPASTVMTLNQSGDVGIGTASPNNYSGYTTLTLNGSSGSEIDFEQSGTLTGDIFVNTGGLFVRSVTAVPLIFSTSATERMRITSGGNVGIGTTNPYTRLRVDGDISAEYSSTIYLDYAVSPNSYKKGFSGVNQSTNSARGLHIFNYDADSNDGINFWLGTNAARVHAAIITNAGNVGIGVTEPRAQLSIKNQIDNGSNPVSSYSATSGAQGQNFFNGYYALNSGGSGTFPRYFDMVSVGSPDGTNGGSNIRFFTNPIATSSPAVERMRINSAGNVQLSFNPGGGQLFFQDVTNGATMFYIIPATYVGSAPYNVNRLLAANSSHIGFETGGSERMRITSGGNFDYGGFSVQSSNNSVYRQAFWGAMSIMWRNAEDSYINSNHTYSSSNTNVASYTSGNGIGRLGIYGGFLEWGSYDGSVSAGTAYTLSSKFIITKAGNVGIGTTSPNFKTHISTGDTTSITQPTAGTYGLYIQQNTSGNVGGLYIQDGASNNGNAIFVGDNNGVARFVANTDGNIGICTSSPTQKLEVVGGEIKAGRVDSSNEGGQVSFGRASDNATGWYIDAYGSTSSPSLRFVNVSDSLVVMSITGSAIGIGTTSPASPLSVWGAGGMGVYSSNSYASTISLNFNNGTNIGHLLADQNAYYIRTLTSYPIYVQPNSANGVYISVGATSWTSNSDERLKTITGNIENAIDDLMTLRTIKHTWKSDDTNKEHLALIAQDVEKIFPQIIDKSKLPTKEEKEKDETEYLGVRYVELIPVLVKAIQELKQQNDELKAEIDILKNK
jgi:hypothetical protein